MDIKQQVQAALDKIRPMLQADGGDVELVELAEEETVARVRLQGACQGCPGAAMTLKMGVERVLKAEVPQIDRVEAV